MPVNREIPLVGRESLGGAYVRLTFRHPEVAREARPGQFVMIKSQAPSDSLLRRPFSILTVAPAAETFSLFLKAVGPGSRALFDMQLGQLASCLGPLGNPFTLPPVGTEALLVAGGYGIAPFRIMSEAIARQSGRALVFYGGRTAADLPMRGAFADLGVPVVAATEDGSEGTKGRVTAPLESYLDQTHGPVALYACGPDAMMHAVAGIAARRGLPSQVSLDPWMGCGVGTCLGCVVKIQKADEGKAKNRCACTVGPVFDSAEVVWAGDAASVARIRAMEEQA
jgi:dihydroorotate dehydrogenase electron transfer subunit